VEPVEYLVFWAAFAATAISVLSLSYIVYREHDRSQPHNLSELAASQEHLLWRFRKILWVCGSLFAVTVYGFIVPKIENSFLIFIAWTIVYVSSLLLATIPARGKTLRTHNSFAQMMAGGMLLLAINIGEPFGLIELCISAVMMLFAVLVVLDKKRFIVYELSFIYSSHVSILAASFSLL
jgi:hypothetical protein